MKSYIPFARLERAREVFDRALDRPDPNFGRAPLGAMARIVGDASRLAPAQPVSAPACQARKPARHPIPLTEMRRGYEATPHTLDTLHQWGASHARAHARFTDRGASDAEEARVAREKILAHAEKRARHPFGASGSDTDRALAEYAAHTAAAFASDPVLGMTDEQVIEHMLADQRLLLEQG